MTEGAPTDGDVRRSAPERVVVWTTLVLTAVLDAAAAVGWHLTIATETWTTVLVGLLTAPCAFLTAWRLVEAVGSRVVAPARPLDRHDVLEALDGEHKTVVVYPLLVVDEADIDDIVDSVRRNRRIVACHRVGHLVAADRRDAAQPSAEDEIDLLARLGRRLEEVAREDPHLGPVHAVVRRQRLNEQTGEWMGWERKRGNLLELAAAARDGSLDAFRADDAAAALLVGARNLLTLDAGTLLHPDTVPILAGVAAAHQRAGARTAIAQPGYRLVPPAEPDWYRAIVLGGMVAPGPGRQPLLPSFMQRTLGRDRYGGQALLVVEPFLEALEAAIPENTVLSHDKLEGAYARTVHVGDAVILGRPVGSYFEHRRRQSRWARGDVQLLPWLLGRHGPPGGLRPWDRTAMTADIAVFVVDVASVLLLVLVWASVDGTSATVLTVLVPLLAAARLVPMLVSDVVSGLPGGPRQAATRLRRALVSEVLYLVFLADRALYVGSATVVTVWRLVVTRRNLLRWQPRSAARRAVSRSPRTRWIAEMWPATVLAVAVLVLLVVLGGGVPPAAAVVLVIWALSPAVAGLLSRPGPRRPPVLDPVR